MIEVNISEEALENDTIEQIQKCLSVGRNPETIEKSLHMCNTLIGNANKYEHFKKKLLELLENEDVGKINLTQPQEVGILLEYYLRALSIKQLPNIKILCSKKLNLLDFIDISKIESAALPSDQSLHFEEFSSLIRVSTFSFTILETIYSWQLKNVHRDLLSLKLDIRWLNTLNLVQFQKIIKSLNSLGELSIRISKRFRKYDNSIQDQKNCTKKIGENSNLQLEIPQNVKVLEFNIATFSLLQLEDISRDDRFLRIFMDEINPKDLLPKLSACKNIQVFKEETGYYKYSEEQQFYKKLLKQHESTLHAICYFGDILQEIIPQSSNTSGEQQINSNFQELRVIKMTIQETISDMVKSFLKGVILNNNLKDNWRYLKAEFRGKQGMLIARKNKYGNCESQLTEMSQLINIVYMVAHNHELDWILDLRKNQINLNNNNLNLQILKFKVDYETLQLTSQQIIEIISFVCSFKTLETLKLTIPHQVYTSQAYEILAKEIDSLTQLKIAEIYLRFNSQFHDTEHLREMLRKMKTLKHLWKFTLFVGGYGSEFEIFAVESVACNAIQEIQIENHVKSQDTAEIYMDYIEEYNKRMDLWKRIIKSIQVKNISFYYEKSFSKLSEIDELSLIIEIIENPNICKFTTSTFLEDYRDEEEEEKKVPKNIDVQIARLYNLRLHFTVFTKVIRQFLSVNPALVIFDLLE